MLWPNSRQGRSIAGASAAAAASASSAMSSIEGSAKRLSRPGYVIAHSSTSSGSRDAQPRYVLAVPPAGGKQTIRDAASWRGR